MKKIKKLPCLIFALFIALAVFFIAFLCGGGEKVYAASDYDPYSFEYSRFYATYDIRADRTMDVTLDLGVHYTGYSSTGILFDIPVNSGDRVRNLKAYELDGDGKEVYLAYDVKSEETNLITVDMGDYTNKYNQTHYYRIKYEYAITKPAKNEKNCIYLNAIGFGHQAVISDAKITLNLPDGFTGAQCWSGPRGTSTGYEKTDDIVIDGNTVTYEIPVLHKLTGVTFQLGFESGVLSTKPDMTPYWVIIAACVILAILFAMKFLLFNRDGLTPIVNVEAPDGMDPLVMGKLIDNKVDKSDVTSLIYYWANKGYIKIGMPDGNSDDDIELIQIRTKLPEGSPNYQVKMYEKLFQKGALVKLSELTYTFYPTVERVTKEVNAQNSKLYSGKSFAFAVLFALIGGLVMALTPIVLTLTTVSAKLFLIAPLIMLVPAFIIYGLTLTVRYNRLKLKKSKLALFYAGIALLAAVFSVIYVLILPSYFVETAPKIILCVVGFAIVMLSATLVSRTESYVEKLNHIVGFRDFIMLTEKDKLEAMLEENPELYYQVLPYAIVLGVSDIWENKFAAITIAPPSWTTQRYADGAFDFIIFNSAMRRVNIRMTTTFISRPASSPSSGSFSGGGSHGGSFGGFSGGGHGGGGSRGR